MDTPEAPPRLCSVQITRYRSIRSTLFEPGEELSVLIGPNGSGKTNLLRAMYLLRADVRRRYLGDDSDQLLAPVSLVATYRIGDQQIKYSMELSTVPGEGNQEEIAAAKEVWSGTLTGGEPWRIEIPTSVLLMLARRDGLRSHAARMGIGYERFDPEPLIADPARTDAMASIASFNRRLRYYSASHFTDPGRCPSTFEVEGTGELVDEYSTRGPHRDFVYGLYKLSKNDRPGFDAFLDVVGREGIRLVNGIRFKPYHLSSNEVRVREGTKVVRKKRRRTLVVPVVTVGRSTVGFNQLSDGTFKSLALIFNLFSPNWSMLLLEEPEVCVHHGLLSSIIEIVKAKAKQRQIVMSTHSESVLDLVNAASVFPVRMAGQGTTVSRLDKILTPAQRAALIDYLHSEGNLGEYWKHGGLNL